MGASVSNGRGRRAEEVASWYFRLNGFLSISGFALHSDTARSLITEADLLAVRFPYSVESIRDVQMTDDRWLQPFADSRQTLFAVAEYAVGTCKINAAWRNSVNGSMERAIRRIGFVGPKTVDDIAKAMYDRMGWENKRFAIRFVVVGKRISPKLRGKFHFLVQLTWNDVSQHLWERFQGFGLLKGAPNQWPRFGRDFAEPFVGGRSPTKSEAADAVRRYIDRGSKIWNAEP